MRFTQLLVTGVITISSVILPAIGWAKPPSLESRIDYLEQLVQGQLSIDTVNKLESMQQEVLELRGILEEQTHELQLLNKRQEKLFADLDQRVDRLDSNNNKSDNKISKKKVDSKTSNTEQTAYSAAYQLLESKQYADALTSFQDLLWQFPEGEYAANSHYWLGEIYLLDWQQEKANELLLDKSINSFSTVVAKYKDHNKAVDALLKLGMIEVERENWPQAKAYFVQLKQQYPDSSRSSLAASKLQQLEHEGRI